MKITLSEGLGWLKTLKARHAELVNLRNQNSADVTDRYGDRETKREPKYDAKALDKQIVVLAKEIRTLEMKIKRINATTAIPDYDMRDEVLGDLV